MAGTAEGTFPFNRKTTNLGEGIKKEKVEEGGTLGVIMPE
jgi:hypothetical protein